MNWIKQLFSRRRLYEDLSSEMQEHLNEKIEELVAAGMSREDAAGAGGNRCELSAHAQDFPNRSRINAAVGVMEI